jgi:hypothetical protein
LHTGWAFDQTVFKGAATRYGIFNIPAWAQGQNQVQIGEAEIQVHEQSAVPRAGQVNAQIRGQCGLAHTTLAAGDQQKGGAGGTHGVFGPG